MSLDEKIKILYPKIEPIKIIIYKDQGIALIRNYLNIKDSNEIIAKIYESALFQIICNAIEGAKINNIKQKSEGSTSITFKDSKSFVISEDVKSLLPSPFVKLMG